jgi:hypothetical protein
VHRHGAHNVVAESSHLASEIPTCNDPRHARLDAFCIPDPLRRPRCRAYDVNSARQRRRGQGVGSCSTTREEVALRLSTWISWTRRYPLTRLHGFVSDVMGPSHNEPLPMMMPSGRRDRGRVGARTVEEDRVL